VQVVVVVREHLDDARRPVKRRGRPHEHQLGAGGHEPVDQILGQPAVDLRGGGRRALAAVEPWVADVGIEAVLVGRVPDAAGPKSPPPGRDRSPTPTRGAPG